MIYTQNNLYQTIYYSNVTNCGNRTLSRNTIVEMAKDKFYNLLRLMWLDLSFNQLKTLHKDTFKPLSNLLHLCLTENHEFTIIRMYIQ